MLSPTLVTPPTGEVVTLEEAKVHLRQDNDAEDTLIQAMIDAAVNHIDGFTGTLGRAIMTQTWSQEYDGFSGDLVLPLVPVASVTSVAYDATTFTAYRLLRDGRGDFLRVNDDTSWPSTVGPVVVTFVAGETTPPSAIKAAVLLHVGTLYENRTTFVERVAPSMAYEALLSPYRIWSA